MENNVISFVAGEKFSEDSRSGKYPNLNDNVNNYNTYVLGFDKGIAYATDIYLKQLESLTEQVKILTQLKS